MAIIISLLKNNLKFKEMKKNFVATACILMFTQSCKEKKEAVITNDKDTVVVKSDSTNIEKKSDKEPNIISKNLGKYPSEIKLFADNTIGSRIKTLSGKHYDAIVKNFNVESPIVEESEIYKTTGCKKNDCPTYSTTILYDAKNDNLNIIINENSKSTVLKEKGEIPYSSTLKSK